MSELERAIARLEEVLARVLGALPDYSSRDGEVWVPVGDLRTVIEAAKGLPEYISRYEAVVDERDAILARRPPLSEATRERLSFLVNLGAYPEDIADAILAEFRPVASTRDRIIEALTHNVEDTSVDIYWWSTRERIIEALTRGVEDTSGDIYWWSDQEARSIAEALFEAGAVEDSAEVAAKALEDAAERIHAGPTADTIIAGLRARAKSIREGLAIYHQPGENRDDREELPDA